MPRSAVDKANPIPRYLQVRSILEEAIRAGEYAPGGRLPGERELAQQLTVSQMTVNKAILGLVEEGWLRREVGNGTFVREDLDVPAPPVVRIGFAVPFAADEAQGDFYLGSLLQGIQRAVVNAPISLTIVEVAGHAHYARLADAPVDGCVVTDVSDEDLVEVHRLIDAGKPVVILGADRDPLHVPFVDSDNYGGARAAMDHLLGLGHERIAGVFAFMDTCNSRHRWRAYRDALADRSLAVPESFVLTYGSDYPLLEPLHRRVHELLDASPRPTAFFCGGYYIALEVMKTVQEAGLRVPDDISVVGFDDPVSARYLTPPLTTVRQPLEDMGKLAVTVLREWLTTREVPPLRHVLPVQLVVRESTGPASSCA